MPKALPWWNWAPETAGPVLQRGDSHTDIHLCPENPKPNTEIPTQNCNPDHHNPNPTPLSTNIHSQRWCHRE